MKNLMIMMALVTLGFAGQAQFVNRETVLLSNTQQPLSVEWADLDNDSQLDIIVFSVDAGGSGYFTIYRNLESKFQVQPEVATGIIEPAFFLADFDLDNRIDVIVSGLHEGERRTLVFSNTGNFQFSESVVLDQRGDIVRLADLDGDGQNEFILSGDDVSFTRIYAQHAGTWEEAGDTIEVSASFLSVRDYDLDMRNDILISGEAQDGTDVQTILFNEGNFIFSRMDQLPVVRQAVLTEGDFNGEGTFDVLVSGIDSLAKPYSRIVNNNGRSYQITNTTLSPGVVSSLFAADLNSDGLTDFNVTSVIGGNVSNVNLLQGGNEESLPAADLVAQRFGDADRDGDLDLVQLRSGTFVFYENTVPEVNQAPVKSPKALTAIIYDRLLVYWDKATDDHTQQASLSYDLTLQGPGQEIIMGEFDNINGRRTTVTYGNMGFNNFALLKDLPYGQYSYFIQAIDNSFHAALGGVCQGSGMPCGEMIALHEIAACRNEKVTLESDGEALWFSFTNGYLGRLNGYTYDRVETDTLFSIVPGADLGCPYLTIYNIQRENDLIRESLDTQYACDDSWIRFDAESSWDSIAWSTPLLGFISNEESIDFHVAGPDTVIVQLFSWEGCPELRKTAIAISQPEIGVADMTYQILQGESVQLNVPGGETYSWLPIAGLDNPNIPNPVATPAATTGYTVTLTDSLGCTGQVNVLIIVEDTAFVPNLFTPNQDGKNDALKIYGLDDVGNFSFRIYNREGGLVYRTEDLTDAAVNGWDGSVQGVLQPAGVYHWKIRGAYNNGKKLLLNGKEMGSLVLIR